MTNPTRDLIGRILAAPDGRHTPARPNPVYTEGATVAQMIGRTMHLPEGTQRLPLPIEVVAPTPATAADPIPTG